MLTSLTVLAGILALLVAPGLIAQNVEARRARQDAARREEG